MKGLVILNSVCIWGITSIILLEIGNAFLLKYAPALRIYLTINVNCLLTMIPFTFDADNNIILIPQLFLVWTIVYYFNDAGYINWLLQAQKTCLCVVALPPVASMLPVWFGPILAKSDYITHCRPIIWYISYVSTFSSRSLKDVANYLIVIKSFIYDLLSVPGVVFMSIKSRPYRPPGSILFIQL